MILGFRPFLQQQFHARIEYKYGKSSVLQTFSMSFHFLHRPDRLILIINQNDIFQVAGFNIDSHRYSSIEELGSAFSSKKKI
jgi:hypothetical protein